jgi:hypothetical protein
MGDGKRQHEGVGIDSAREVNGPAESDGQHEEVDRQQIQREKPDGFLQMVLVDVFHDDDLKLPGQTNHGQHRQDNFEAPAEISPGGALDDKEVLQSGQFRSFRKQMAESLEYAVGHKNACRKKRYEFDERFKRDGGHHPFVPLGGVQVAGAEEDRKKGQQQGHVERRVVNYGNIREITRHDDERVLVDDEIAHRNGFELERDVGNDAQHGDNRHQACDGGAFAVARGDKIGDGGDAVGFADADDLADHQHPQGKHQGRPDIGRQEPGAAGCRPPHAAVEGPGGAIDRQGKGVNIGVADQASAPGGALVREMGDGEQQCHVPEGQQQDGFGCKHGTRQEPVWSEWVPKCVMKMTMAMSPAQAANM